MVIRQGDLYWVDLGEPQGSEPGFRRPYVVIQNDLFSRSRLNTVIACALTAVLSRGMEIGNVLLDAGEGSLPKPSVVVVSQIYTVDKSVLTDHIGTLSQARVREILQGLRLLTEPRDLE